MRLWFRAMGTFTLAMAMTGALLVASQTDVRADDGTDFLKKMEGSWKGRGKAKRTIKSAEEAILCQITSKLNDKGTVLSTSGKCASAQTKVNISGELRYLPATQVFTGNLFSRGDDEGKTSSTGGISGSNLVLKLVTTDNLEQIVSRGLVTIAPKSASSYAIKTNVTETKSNQTFTAADISFKKQK